MSEYPFLHNLIVDAYQRGRDNNVSVFDLQDFIKNNEDGFEDWIHCERIEPLERQLKEEKAKTKALLVGLEVQHLNEFLKRANVENYKELGENITIGFKTQLKEQGENE